MTARADPANSRTGQACPPAPPLDAYAGARALDADAVRTQAAGVRRRRATLVRGARGQELHRLGGQTAHGSRGRREVGRAQARAAGDGHSLIAAKSRAVVEQRGPGRTAAPAARVAPSFLLLEARHVGAVDAAHLLGPAAADGVPGDCAVGVARTRAVRCPLGGARELLGCWFGSRRWCGARVLRSALAQAEGNVTGSGAQHGDGEPVPHGHEFVQRRGLVPIQAVRGVGRPLKEWWAS